MSAAKEGEKYMEMKVYSIIYNACFVQKSGRHKFTNNIFGNESRKIESIRVEKFNFNFLSS